MLFDTNHRFILLQQVLVLLASIVMFFVHKFEGKVSTSPRGTNYFIVTFVFRLLKFKVFIYMSKFQTLLQFQNRFK